MNDSGQMMPYQELWERLKQVTGERNRLEAELAALEANPPLAEVEGWVILEQAREPTPWFAIFQAQGSPDMIPVTVTVRGRGDVPEPPAISSSIR